MMVPKEQLSAEDVRQIVEQSLREHLHLAIDGYKGDTSCVIQVLVKAAIEDQTIESICTDLGLEVSSNTVRERLNQSLDVCDLRLHECGLNAGLVGCIPAELPRRGRAMALDYHAAPFCGKTPELRSYACRGAATEETTHFYRVATVDGMWRQVRVRLAMTYVLPEDSNLSVVQRLVQRMQRLGFAPGVLYMDEEFCEGPIVRYLTTVKIPAILACTIRGTSGATRSCAEAAKAIAPTTPLAMAPLRVSLTKPDADGSNGWPLS